MNIWQDSNNMSEGDSAEELTTKEIINKYSSYLTKDQIDVLNKNQELSILEKIVVEENSPYVSISVKYAPDKMPYYWAQDDRYIRDAKKMNDGCIVVECNLEDAKNISSYYVSNLFSIPTTTYYDGNKLSLCFDYTGRNAHDLKDRTLKFIFKYFTYKIERDNKGSEESSS